MKSKKKLLIGCSVLLLLGAILTAVFVGCDWPPPRLILKYGFPPAGGPTGEVVVIEGIEFVVIEPGYYQMGSHVDCKHGGFLARAARWVGLSQEDESNRVSHECPPHWVEFGSGFGISMTEISNEQYWRFDPDHAASESANHPVTNVSPQQARRYCEWLSAQSGRHVRLPSEAEWEASCRAGTSTEYSFGEDGAELSSWGFFSDNSDWCKQPVGLLQPNQWGLFDFHGNVAEWCEDRYHGGYSGSPTDSSAWTEHSDTIYFEGEGVVRGGCYRNGADQCRSASRLPFPPEPCPYVGLRLALGGVAE